MVEEWLKTGMFKNEIDSERLAVQISAELSSHEKYKTHNRHLSADECKNIGLKIFMMEDNQELQDAILSVHHAFMISLGEFNGPIKIVENNTGSTMLFNKMSNV